MRDPGVLRAMALHRWTGNWELDSRGVLPEELDEFEAAWKLEAQRRYELKEHARKAMLKVS